VQGRRPKVVEIVRRGECHICTSHAPHQHNGYPKVRRRGKAVYLHRYVFEQVYGPIPPGMCVCHICDNGQCINPSHLFIGTKADNNEDMTRKGRRRAGRGEKAGAGKLAEEEVLTIFRSSGTQKQLGIKYGVTHQSIGAIKRGDCWGWLTGAGG